MLSYLPRYYESSEFMAELLEATGSELDSLRGAIESLLGNAFVRTATDWGLDRWEAELGLAPAPSLTELERQDRIIGHLRGFGTATREAVARVASAYAYGSVSVEDQDNDPVLVYTVRITFTDDTGIPSNLEDVQRAVRAIVPAHLEVVYVFTYNTWDDVDAARLTWDEIDALGLTWDEWDELNL